MKKNVLFWIFGIAQIIFFTWIILIITSAIIEDNNFLTIARPILIMSILLSGATVGIEYLIYSKK